MYAGREIIEEKLSLKLSEVITATDLQEKLKKKLNDELENIKLQFPENLRDLAYKFCTFKVDLPAPKIALPAPNIAMGPSSTGSGGRIGPPPKLNLLLYQN